MARSRSQPSLLPSLEEEPDTLLDEVPHPPGLTRQTAVPRFFANPDFAEKAKQAERPADRWSAIWNSNVRVADVVMCSAMLCMLAAEWPIWAAVPLVMIGSSVLLSNFRP